MVRWWPDAVVGVLVRADQGGWVSGSGCWLSELLEAGEGRGEVVGPGPAVGDAQSHAAGGAGDAGGYVQQPVAQFLRFGGGQLAVQEQVLGPGEQVDGGQRELQPRLVDCEHAGGEATKPGVLAGTDAVLYAGVAAVAQLQVLDGSVPDRGVGGEKLVTHALDGVEQR